MRKTQKIHDIGTQGFKSFLPQLKEINFASSEASPLFESRFCLSIPNTERLNISYCNWWAEGPSLPLPKVRHLIMRGCMRVLKTLAQFPNLEALNASYLRFDTRIEPISKLSQLKSLRLHRSFFNEKELSKLAALVNLEFIDLRGCFVTRKENFECSHLQTFLKAVPKLKTFKISGRFLTDDILKLVGPLIPEAVTTLALCMGAFSDLTPLQMKEITSLDLSSTQSMSSNALPDISRRWKNIAYLNLESTNVQDEGVCQFCEHAGNALVSLNLQSTGVTQQVLQAIGSNCLSLQTLNIKHTAIQPASEKYLGKSMEAFLEGSSSLRQLIWIDRQPIKSLLAAKKPLLE